VGAELFHEEGRNRQTNMKKLIVAFHNFAKAPDANIINCSSPSRNVFWIAY